MDREGTSPVKAVRTNFRIIEALRDLDGAGVTELARHVDLAKSSVHDHLQTLVDCGYVYKTESVYRIAPRFVELGGYARRSMPVYRAAKPEVERLATETRTRVSVTVELGGSGVVVAGANRSDDADGVEIESTLSLLETAPGRALLAHLSDDRIELVLAAADRDAADERDELRKVHRRIRRDGYAHERMAGGIHRVAIPIKDSQGAVSGALGLSGAAERVRAPSSSGGQTTHRRGSVGAMNIPERRNESVRQDPAYKHPWKGSIHSPRRSESTDDEQIDEKILAAMRRAASVIGSRLGRV